MFDAPLVRNSPSFPDGVPLRTNQKDKAGAKNPHHQHKKRADRAIGRRIEADVPEVKVHAGFRLWSLFSKSFGSRARHLRG
jgi:hypothetical protein